MEIRTFDLFEQTSKFIALSDKCWKIEDYPDAITDRYGVDFKVGECPVAGEFSSQKALFDRILTELQEGKVLPVPEKCGTETFDFVVMVLGNIKYVIQTRYYLYFYYRYPGCEFLATDMYAPIGVRHNNDIVGIIMPMIIPGV